MKTQSLTTGLVLLSAAFLLGCQDMGPTTPEAQPIVLMEAAAPVAVSAVGTVISVNRAEKHGALERTDDGSLTVYQFNIPSVFQGFIQVGRVVPFTIDPENSRHAILTSGCIPPDCGG